jgi:hypothetical protein
MQKITVNKRDLLTTVQGNLATHVTEYTAAAAGWRSAVSDRLMTMLDDLAEGKDVDLYLTRELSRPTSHEEDYKRSIEMLKWDTSDTVTLDEKTFRELVQGRP